MASSVDKNVNVNINAKDNATAPLNQVANKFDGISKQMDGMSRLPGPIGDNVRGIGNAVDAVKGTFTGLESAMKGAEGEAGTLGAAMTAAMGPVVLVIAGVVAAVGLLAAAGDKAVNSFTGWADKVKAIQDVTGASAELSSAIAHIGEITGVSSEQIATMFAQFDRQLEAAKNAQDKYNQQVTDANLKASQQIVDIGQKYAGEIEKTTQQAADHIQAIQQTINDNMATYLDDQATRAGDYASKLQDLQSSLQSKLADMEQSHADKIASINQSKADATDQVQQNAADRQDQLTQKLSDLEQQKADAIASYSERIANATTEAQKLALAQQYNAALANINKQETDAQQAAAKADARDQANLQKQLDRLNKQQAAEDAANAKAQQRAKDEEAKQEAAADKAYQRQEAAAEKHNNQMVLAAQKQEAQIAAVRDQAIMDDQMKRTVEQDKVLRSLDALRAAAPSSPFIDALDKMNIKFEDFIKLPMDQQITTLFDGLNGIQDQSTKTALEMALFGRGAIGMNEVLDYVAQNGMTSIYQKTKDANEMMDQQALKDAEWAKWAKNEGSSILDGYARKLGEELAPAQAKMNEAFNKMYTTYGPQMTGTIDQVAKSIGGLYDNLTKVATWVNNNVGGITGAINTIRDLFNTLNTLNSFTPTGFIANNISSALGFRAGGGPVGAGQPYVVGERGPELFVPNNSGWISPNVTYNYSPTYGQAMAPNEPASFNLFKAMAGAS